jgi:hypothetical protein
VKLQGFSSLTGASYAGKTPNHARMTIIERQPGVVSLMQKTRTLGVIRLSLIMGKRDKHPNPLPEEL